MQVGELATHALSIFGTEEVNCPYEEPHTEGGLEVADESMEDDDEVDWEDLPPAQRNKADKLGKNIVEGTKGDADSGPYPPDGYLFEQAQVDTKRSEDEPKVRVPSCAVPGKKTIPEGEFPFTVAAHHIVPGKASGLAKNAKLRSALRDYMDKGCEVEGSTLKFHIGYDVNGSHNGIWLPGWYAIRNVEGMSWKQLETAGYVDWQLAYVAAVCKEANGQFHDSHGDPYSESIKQVLLKLHEALVFHQHNCEKCLKRGAAPIPPPFRLKHRLYTISQKIRGFLRGHPASWKEPWWTSERWLAIIFPNGKISKKFLDAYNATD